MKTYKQFTEGLISKTKEYMNRGKYEQMPDEDTASLGKLVRNDLKQVTHSDDAYKSGKTSIKTLRPFKAFTDPKMRATGPSPLIRQSPRLIKQGLSKLNPFK